jgi:hypothetical protein
MLTNEGLNLLAWTSHLRGLQPAGLRAKEAS